MILSLHDHLLESLLDLLSLSRYLNMTKSHSWPFDFSKKLSTNSYYGIMILVQNDHVDGSSFWGNWNVSNDFMIKAKHNKSNTLWSIVAGVFPFYYCCFTLNGCLIYCLTNGETDLLWPISGKRGRNMVQTTNRLIRAYNDGITHWDALSIHVWIICVVINIWWTCFWNIGHKLDWYGYHIVFKFCCCTWSIWSA